MASHGSGLETRQRLMRAATDVVKQHGPAALTLEAVADAAGVSKGGLLYHFPNKDALIEGMVDDVLRRFEADVEMASQTESHGEGRWLRAFVKTTFAAEPEHDLSVGLLAAAAVNPGLLAPVGRYFANWQARATADGVDATLATVVRLADDGIWFSDLFDAAPPGEELRASVLDALLDLIAAGVSPKNEEGV